MVIKEFRLPDLGEGLTESELVTWRVAEGDTVSLNQVIAEIETAKALVELPSPHAGIVSRLYVAAGVTVNVGDPIIAFEIDGPTADADSPADSPAGASGGASGGASLDGSGVQSEELPPNLVGYGAIADPRGAPARRVRAGLDVSAVSAAPETAEPVVPTVQAVPAVQPVRAIAVHERVRSTPPVRLLARQRGIDIEAITGTGLSGLVTRQDLDGHSGNATGLAPIALEPAPDSSGRLSTPVKGVRKLMADAMVASAFTAPHVTIFVTVDVTKTVDLLANLRTTPQFRDVRLTFLAAVCKAVCLGIARHPQINSRWDEASASIIQFAQVNLGIAAATPRGLVVPNITAADAMDLRTVATTLAELVRTAKDGKTSPADMTGGTFTISNIGVFGMDAGTPILNNGEAAILAIGAVARRPWEFEGQLALRELITLSLSFDHRVLDGEQGSRFLNEVAQLLNDPAHAFAL